MAVKNLGGGSEVLPYWQASKLSFRSFMDAGRDIRLLSQKQRTVFSWHSNLHEHHICPISPCPLPLLTSLIGVMWSLPSWVLYVHTVALCHT